MRSDPVTLGVLSARFQAIADEMATVVQRTASTIFVVETADFTTMLLDTRGRVFACPMKIGITVFVGLDCRKLLELCAPAEEGDVFVTNDWHGTKGASTHLSDIVVIRPFFWKDRLIGYGYAFSHATDVGGKLPGSISPTSSDTFQEGIRIPVTKLFARDEVRDDVLQMILANCRAPHDNWGDIKGLVAAMRMGENRIRELCDRYGAEMVGIATEDVIEVAGEKARAAVRRIPDGEYRFADYLDSDVVSDHPVRLALNLTVTGDELMLDWSHSATQVQGAFNVPTGGTNHPWITYRALTLLRHLDPTIPFNSGLLTPIQAKAPEGSVLNPHFPAATGVRFPTALRANDVMLGALAQALPSQLPAAGGGAMVPVVFSEPDPASGRPRVLTLQVLLGGTGGNPKDDGIDGRNCELAMLRNTPVEVTERNASVEVLAYRLRQDSGGAGFHRGGTGIEYTVRVLRPGCVITARGLERYNFQPWGLEGGLPGIQGRTILNRGTPQEREIGRFDALAPAPHDVVTFLTAGGGGWGNPLERPGEKVLADFQSGVVSVQAAQSEYGVVIKGDEIDWVATEALRARMAPEARAGTYSFGQWRSKHERTWSEALQDQLVSHLFATPVALRSYVSKVLVNWVIAESAQGAPIGAAQLTKRWEEMREKGWVEDV